MNASVLIRAWPLISALEDQGFLVAGHGDVFATTAAESVHAPRNKAALKQARAHASSFVEVYGPRS